ncbi:kinase [Alphaproteobacteria bacterium]|nr:kinase [Alphaproteobacteria bacterium]
MIICRTPFRVSFFGGGTDYPAWYYDNGGAVISATINKYSYITARWLPPFFEYKHRIRYFRTEEVASVGDIEHPSVREVVKHLKIEKGLEIVHNADLPARSGLGSSSAFTVGMLHSLYSLQNKMPSKRQLGLEAILIEQEKIGESVGSQDQVAAAFGGLNYIKFSQGNEFLVDPIIVSEERIRTLEKSIVLVFTGFARTASELAEKQISAIPKITSELNLMKQICDEALSIMVSPGSHILELGPLLNEQWKIKRKITDFVSNAAIDSIYELGMKNGAVGGKLLGAGGGGFMMFLVPNEKRDLLIESLDQKMVVPFRFDFQGSQIVYHASPE